MTQSRAFPLTNRCHTQLPTPGPRKDHKTLFVALACGYGFKGGREMINRRSFLKNLALTSAYCIARQYTVLAHWPIAGPAPQSLHPRSMPSHEFPKWLLGQTIIFNETGKKFNVCCVGKSFMLIKRADEKTIRTIKSQTKGLSGKHIPTTTDCLKYWSHKGQSLEQFS